MWSFARWGGAFTPPLVIITFRYISWRWAFVVFGLLGLVWCFFFNRWFRDRPQDHPGVNAAEQELLKEVSALSSTHGDVPWAKLVSTRTVWLLWAQYSASHFPGIFTSRGCRLICRSIATRLPKQARASRFFRCCSAVSPR